MKRSQLFLSFFILLLVYPAVAHAQLWNGVIAPARAMDWSQAGIPGGPPDANWPICTTLNPGVTGAQITAALTNCHNANPSGGVVLLNAGTYTISDQISIPSSNLVLRGSGANSTFLVATGATPVIRASGDGTARGNGGANLVHNWTGGYAKGATQLTLDSTSGIVANQSVLVLNQCDTGFSGATCTGTPIDNNGYFVCATPWTSPGVGCNIAGESADGQDWRAPAGYTAWQQEYAKVIAISGNVVTIEHPLAHPNWNSANTPQVVVIQPISQIGIENLSLDGTAISGVQDGIWWQNTYRSWITGCRVFNFGHDNIRNFDAVNDLFQSNYVFGNPASYGDNAGFQFSGGGYNVVQNNICQQVHVCILNDGPHSTSVFGYNYSVNQYAGPSGNTAYMWYSVFEHGGPSNGFNLYEGNEWTGTNHDIDHGGHLNMTQFRNFNWGWESCANNQCGGATSKQFTGPYVGAYGTRYSAHIGNVLGTPGVHNTYQTAGRFDSATIWQLGGAYGSQPSDLLSSSTTLRWGNWDAVTKNVRFCGSSLNIGWSTICGSISEVPIGAASYPNPLPTLGDLGIGQGALPASLYLSAKPSWFGSTPWPAIGPDVTGGNVGQCGGTLNSTLYAGLASPSASKCASGQTTNTSAWAGHVNAIPAMACYFSIGGVPDGTGRVLPFDAKTCYGGTTSSQGPAPPTSLVLVITTN